MNRQRIKKDYQDLKNDPLKNTKVLQIGKFSMKAPDSTPYKGFYFDISIIYPSMYPFKPPKVMFLTPILHPNVTKEGVICLSILKDSWSPLLSTRTILISIQYLLENPNFEDPVTSYFDGMTMEEYVEQARSLCRRHG